MRELAVRGIGFWTSGVGDWHQAKSLLAAGAPWPTGGSGDRPAPTLIHANERRRAPDSVLLALAVAEQACAAAGVDPRSVPSVFVSTYGDLAINDYMCRTLATDPTLLSPTKFHNSVHNAPSGYWSIATGAMRATTAVAGWHESFGNGLLEAAVQIGDEDGPVLLATYDVAGAGPMAELVQSSHAFGCAFLLDGGAPAAMPRLRLETAAVGAAGSGPGDPGFAGGNPTARAAGALLAALARGEPRDIRLRLSPALDLVVGVTP